MNKMKKVFSSFFFILVWFWIWGICFRKLDYINYASTCVVCTLTIGMYITYLSTIRVTDTAFIQFTNVFFSIWWSGSSSLTYSLLHSRFGNKKFIKRPLLFFQKISKTKLAIFSNNFQTPLTITTHSSSPDCFGKF